MPGLHSKKSPSSAHRWRACPASIQEEHGLPDSAGEAAIQGTVFHDYAADCAVLGLDPQYLVGDKMLCEDGKYREFTAEMANGMLPGLDLIWSLADANGAELFVEVKLDLSRWLGPNEFGTSDVGIVDVYQKSITVFDWKWGAGVPISPEHNDQAILYTLGFWATIAEEKFEGIRPSEIEVKVIIEQPRAPGGGGVWTTTMADILEEGEGIRRDADLAESGSGKYVPGEKQCKFCKAAYANTCVARAEFLQDLLVEIYEEDDPAVIPDLARAIDPRRRTEIILRRPMIEGWLQQLHDEAMEDARRGLPTPGMKRVLGRSPPRRWSDESKAEILLLANFGKDAFTRELLSPTAVERAVGKKRYRELYQRHVAEQQAKEILVAETDGRDALPSYESMFDDVAEEDKLANLI